MKTSIIDKVAILFFFILLGIATLSYGIEKKRVKHTKYTAINSI